MTNIIKSVCLRERERKSDMEETSIHSLCSTISPVPSWKLYDNPFFNTTFHSHHQRHNHRHRLNTSCPREHHEFPSMEPDVSGSSLSRMREMKAELELERRLRKKAESLNNMLARELSEEKQRRELMERQLEDLSEEASRARADMERFRAEVVEERRMMRVAELLREERVQMKMLEARLLMEEKLVQISTPSSQMPETQKSKSEEDGERKEIGDWRENVPSTTVGSSSSGTKNNNKKKHRKEIENPHIRRGIIGYVEFPSRLVRGRAGGLMGSFLAAPTREGKGDVGPKLECQKAQLRVLLKHNNRVTPLGTMGPSGSENLVM